MKPLRRPTSIRDIARAADVSVATVSRALAGDSKTLLVTEKTRKKIAKACDTLGYYPNIHAIRLFFARSNTIAFVVPTGHGVSFAQPSFADPNLSMTLAGLTEAAGLHGQQLVLMQIDQAFVESKQYLTVLRNRSVDGMIIWGVRDGDRTLVSEIIKEHWPLVLANGSIDHLYHAPSVLVDNYGGATLLARRMIELGHRHIAFITSPCHFRAATERLRGFEEVCRQAGARLTVHEAERDGFETSAALTRAILTGPDQPTAIAAMNDVMALGAMAGARHLGLSVPEDISVTGGDDVFPFNFPRLTTFRAPMMEIGRQAILKLLSRIAPGEKERDDDAASDLVLPITLVEGQTLARNMATIKKKRR